MRQHDAVPILLTNHCKTTVSAGPDLRQQMMNGTVEVGKEKSENANVQLPPMPAGLEPLKHQLGGHKFGDKANSVVYGRF